MLKIRSFLFWWKGFTCFKDKSHYISSHRSCSERRGVLSKFAKFTRKHLCQSLFFNKVTGFSLWKERLWRSCFQANFVKFLRTLFYRTEHLWVTASVIKRRQNLSLQSTFLIKLYQPEEKPAVGQILEKDVQCFLCSVVSILNSER